MRRSPEPYQPNELQSSNARDWKLTTDRHSALKVDLWRERGTQLGRWVSGYSIRRSPEWISRYPKDRMVGLGRGTALSAENSVIVTIGFDPMGEFCQGRIP
jgi:hypothetical protein